eukprot:3329238-Amphidinium_carterae.1
MGNDWSYRRMSTVRLAASKSLMNTDNAIVGHVAAAAAQHFKDQLSRCHFCESRVAQRVCLLAFCVTMSLSATDSQ